ncbi:hypothetical protein BMW23_0436 [Bodo saltans virus]|nr:hypothetical protein QJ851_gp0425 [Bodo saltans virus]ATZ80488.1 hypothetical protein BMW23_0436 [Bodo saltans virus]
MLDFNVYRILKNIFRIHCIYHDITTVIIIIKIKKYGLINHA